MLYTTFSKILKRYNNIMFAVVLVRVAKYIMRKSETSVVISVYYDIISLLSSAYAYVLIY